MSRSTQKRLAIIDAAKEEFIEHGFIAANINHICEQAEVSKRTLYRHFASKELLFEAVLMEIQQGIIGQAEYIFKTDEPIERQLQAIIKLEIHTLYHMYGIALSRTIILEFFRQPSLAKDLTQRLYQRRTITSWFEKAIEAGALVADDPQTITTVYLSVFQGIFFWPQVLALVEEPNLNSTDVSDKIDLVARTICRTFAPKGSSRMRD